MHHPILSRARASGASLALAALLTACGGGSGEGLDASGRPPSAGGSDTGNSTASLASIQAKVFTPVCTTCHSGAAAPVGLRLDAANSYAALVGVASGEVPSLKRVNPGSPDTSYIVQKLEGHAAVGARMPLGGPYLDAATIQAIRQWIADGALPSDAATVQPTLASIQAKVFTPVCTTCHSGAAAPVGLRLDAANSHALLVGVNSGEVPTLQRVAAGDPANSYLVQKLEGHAAVGARMPLGGPYLDEATIAAVRTWIANGALKDTP